MLAVRHFFLAADSTVKTIDFIPPVPAGFDVNQVDKAKTESGSNASVTPGNLAGWYALQSRYGRMNFDEVLQPAIRLAQDGFPVSSFFVAMTRGSIGRIKDPEWQRVFRVEQDWQTGQVLQLQTSLRHWSRLQPRVLIVFMAVPWARSWFLEFSLTEDAISAWPI